MKIPGANTIIEYKGRRYYDYYRRNDEVEPQLSYIYLKSRKKIKKKHGVNFIYGCEILEWNGHKKGYDHTEDGHMSIHSIRSMFAHKKPGEMKFLKGQEWDVIVAKTLLIS